MSETTETIRVLHVDDDPELCEIVTTFLERDRPSIDVISAYDPGEGIEKITSTSVDCVVSDYEMPGSNGIEFLERVRERYPDLPFILFTGRGSEDVASKAIEAGVTDYLQKETGTNQYTVLANRIAHAVEGHRSREALAKRTRRLETLISNVPGMVYRCRNEEGWPMLNLEGDVESLTGYIPRALTSGRVSYGDEIIHPDDRAEMYEQVQEAISEDESFEVNYRILTADDETKWVWERGQEIEHAGESFLEGFITEITERRRSKRQLREERDRLATLLENFPSPVVFTELAGKEPVIREVNPAFEETFGYDRDAISGQCLDDVIVPPDERDVAADINETVWEDGEVHGVEVKRQTADGVKQFLLDVVQRQEVEDVREGYAVYRDITNRKTRQDELERSQTLLEALSTAYPDYTFIYGRDGDYLDVITGWRMGPELYEPDELREMNVRDILSEEDAEQVIEAIQTALSTGEHQTVEYGVTTPVGLYWYEGQVVPLPKGYRGEDAVVFAARDITTRKERRRELELQNERLEEFTGIVSHDLQNPLQAASGRLELAREQHDSEHLEKIDELHERMYTMVEDLLELARNETTVEELHPLSLPDLADSCWEPMETAGATLETDTDLVVRAHRRRLRQLLGNLFENAVHHCGEQGTVTVGDLDDQTGFFVADDGPGIPDEIADSVFESGVSTDETGTGFGLTIVERIAHAHDWDVTVTESAEGGARFEIRDVATGEL